MNRDDSDGRGVAGTTVDRLGLARVILFFCLYSFVVKTEDGLRR